MEPAHPGPSPIEAHTDSIFYQDIATLYSYDASDLLEVRQRAVDIEPKAGADAVNAPMSAYAQSPGLPVPDVRHALQLSDGTLWLGTGHGLARRREGVWRYFAGRRWLPHDTVIGLALDEQQRLLATTPGGTAHIASVPMTLEQKARHYEHITAARHNRNGFVASCRLTVPGDLATSVHEATDNDGLWTSLYICAQCFRWAATRDPRARNLARHSMEALLSLVRATGIPGFPARAIIREGEFVEQSDPGPNWYRSPQDSHVLYKDDTSSDEIDGHYLAWYWYTELAATPIEKQEISEICRAVTEHILDHNYTLVGPTGKPTSWGVWSPDKLNEDPEWHAERGLNSLEILSHLKVAAYLCDEPRFEAAYRKLIEDHDYADNTRHQKIVPPDGENNHSDDELAACAYYPLLQLETDPDLRVVYLESLERTHAVLRPERSPFYNVLYSACTGNPFDRKAALEWFREAPWDLRDWKMRNSHRSDVQIATERDRFGKLQLTHVLSPGERRATRWNSNPYEADAGGDGESEEDGTFWLLPYWMSRYHGLL